jgi:hypothetical protein
MHGGPTLLMEMEGSLLIRWVALYALASVWMRGERGEYTCTLALLAGPGWGRAMGVGARCARE